MVADGENNGGGKQVNMLCSQQFSNKADLTTYNTIIIPYCTQDVHIGSKTMTYNNNNNNNDGDGVMETIMVSQFIMLEPTMSCRY